MEERKLDIGGCTDCSACSNNVEEKVREKANLLVLTNTLDMSKIEEKGVYIGNSFKHIENKSFSIECERISVIADDIVVYDNKSKIAIYNDKKVIAQIDTTNKTGILTEVTKPNSDNIEYRVVLDDMIFIDNDDTKYPRIRTEYYDSVEEGNNSSICKIYIKPNSRYNEILAYALELPNMSREQAIFKSQQYVYELENIGDVIKAISVSNNSYIAGLSSITKVMGLGYGGLILESEDILGYHHIAHIEKSAIIFDRTIYTSSAGLSVKVDDGIQKDLTEDEMEVVVAAVSALRRTSNDEAEKKEIMKECNIVSDQLSDLFDSNKEDDISIIINDDGVFTSLSLHSYKEAINNM